MKKIILQSHFLLAVVIFLNSCGPSLKVTSDFDKEANFQQYKTFKIVEGDQQKQTISQLNQDRIIQSIQSEMVKKGFQESNDPELQISTVVVLEDKKKVTEITNFYGYGGAYRPYGWNGGMASANTTYNVQEYKDGSLIIDIVDSKTKKLVWEGIGNKEIDKPLKDPDKLISTAVASILAGFPPGSQKK